jgi:acetate kinase
VRSAPASVLTINGGSSTIKFAVFLSGPTPVRQLAGKIDRIGFAEARFAWRDFNASQDEARGLAAPDHRAAADFLLDWLSERVGIETVAAVGHRIVHGGPDYCEPTCINEEMVAALRRHSPFAPEHLPAQLGLIGALQQRQPALRQVACFDTTFHRDLPRVARLLPIPRRYDAKGVRRYGFHGLSYAFMMEELQRIAGAQAARGRIILAHLGNGASLAALRDGAPVDTSMGFTPSSGLPMSTRSGDLDPGLVRYLANTEQMDATQFNTMVNSQSGLLGLSETSSDVRDLLERESQDVRAAEAIALFCYQVKKWIGSFAAALGGLDTLVFSGGMGENAPEIRARICDGLGFLGIELDEKQNAANACVVSQKAGRVTVRVIRTDEEWMIAKTVCKVLGLNLGKERR